MKQNQSIVVAFHKQSEAAKKEYRIRLNASIDVRRFLVKNALPFRGHDESENSTCRGLFLEALSLLGSANESIHNVILRNAPKNNQMVSPSIQKGIVNCFLNEILKSIFEEIDSDAFALLVDESSDVSKKEHMAVVLRYVDAHRLVKERFVGVVHVMETSSSTLKSAINSLFTKHGLSLKHISLGQGYDGAICASCKRKDMIREGYRDRIQEAICKGEIEIGRGLNQELFLIWRVYSFCQKHGVERLNMEDCYVTSRNRKTIISNRHHFEVDIFNTVLDMQIQEFGDRFTEVSTELLTNMAALSPQDSFSMFDASKLVKLSTFYPYDFKNMERSTLERKLDIYYETMLQDERFTNLDGISSLVRLMVQTGKHISYPHILRLLKLALVLPIVTTTIERCFSAMKLVKSYLRNRMGDDLLNDSLICAIEKETLVNVPNEAVVNRFQSMKERREQW
ncbi:uncharacterized protein LOC127244118 [Andrographis paniculata]|uniref:uncharacterized protein LOC127244118 n=1 Tax=Andrographis paniculata TaxID=175694 RepID=UPI0021E8D3BA|nr:uncharacterized protein LOC127244118 [Andrographis paniculata]